MPAANINQRPSEAASWYVEETTFGTDPGSPTQIYPIAGSVELGAEQAELENDEQRTDLYDALNTVRGLRSGSVKFSAFMRPDTAQLTIATTATTPWLYLPLRTAFGDEWPATGTTLSGDTVSASAASTITVTTPSHFSKGAWCMPTVSGTYEPTRVINIAGSVLTLDPQNSATPTAASAAVLNMYNYAPSRSYSKSFTFRHAINGDAGLQWIHRGCKMDSVEWDLALGSIPKMTFAATAATWGATATGPVPTALGYTATAGTNAMAAPFVMKDCYLIMQASTGTSAARAAHLSVESASIKVDLGTEFVPDLGGAVEAKAGVMRTKGRLFGTMTLRCRPWLNSGVDVFDVTYWTAQLNLQVALIVNQGATTSKRAMVWDMPTCQMVGKPKYVMDGGRQLVEIVLRTKRSAGVTSGTEGNNFHFAPLVFAVG